MSELVREVPNRVEVLVINTRLVLLEGDIVEQQVDAIVNAANEGLMGGSGVDGAIHRAAGWNQLQEACRKIGRCETGEAVITPGFNLRARHIIHTVGPVYAAGRVDEEGEKHNEQAKILLANCYKRSLGLASKNGVRSIAFPAISTGIFEYPIDSATGVALDAILEFITENPEAIDEVRLVMFDDDDFSVGLRKLKEHL